MVVKDGVNGKLRESSSIYKIGSVSGKKDGQNSAVYVKQVKDFKVFDCEILAASEVS